MNYYVIIFYTLTMAREALSFAKGDQNESPFKLASGGGDHKTITGHGILISVRDYFVENCMKKPSKCRGPPIDVSSANLTPERVLAIYYGTCKVNLKAFEAAAREIIKYNIKTDQDAEKKNNPGYHFDAERFVDTNRNMVALYR